MQLQETKQLKGNDNVTAESDSILVTSEELIRSFITRIEWNWMPRLTLIIPMKFSEDWHRAFCESDQLGQIQIIQI